MQKGITYIVRPFMQPLNCPCSVASHLDRVAPVVGRAGVDLLLGADEGAVLDAGDVGRVRAAEERVRALRFIQFAQCPGGTELVEQALVFGLRTIADIDRVRLAKFLHLRDPRC